MAATLWWPVARQQDLLKARHVRGMLQYCCGVNKPFIPSTNKLLWPAVWVIKNACDIDLSCFPWNMLRILFICKTCRVLHHESILSNLIYLSTHLNEDPHTTLPPLFLPSSAFRDRGERDLSQRFKLLNQLKLILHLQQYAEFTQVRVKTV